MKKKHEGYVLDYLYKASEAVDIAISDLMMVIETKPGFGISTKHHTTAKKLLRKLQSVNKKLTLMSRKWMQ